MHCVKYLKIDQTVVVDAEYGLSVKPSVAGDAYSFGVLLLVLFTGKSPTDESLQGEQNLVGWIQSAFPTRPLQVLDPDLLMLMDTLGHEDHSINAELQQECVITILEIGLSCIVGSPDSRISIRHALHKLQASCGDDGAKCFLLVIFFPMILVKGFKFLLVNLH